MDVIDVSTRAEDAEVLRWAWGRFATFDWSATRTRSIFEAFQLGILAVGVATTLVALLHSALRLRGGTSPSAVLHGMVLVFPIALAVLLGIAARFRSGMKWVDLRAAAEGVKRQIYRYRAGVGQYSPGVRRGRSRGEVLTRHVDAIARELMATEVSRTFLEDIAEPRAGSTAAGDDLFSELGPEQYLAFRVHDQLAYYRREVKRRELRLRALFGLTFVLGGAGTLLAALHLDLWIAFTTAIVGAITTYLGYEQVENTIVSYNRAANSLESVVGWWRGLPPASSPAQVHQRFTRLVNRTERVLEREQGGWIQDMSDALADLEEEEERAAESGERGRGRGAAPAETSSTSGAE